MKYVINGVRYHVDTWGTGFPLLLLHGFTGNSEGWKEFAPFWKDHSKTIALDIIGHGKSGSPPDIGQYQIEESAAVINSLLEKMGIGKIDVLGYSMGGRLALTFAVNYPEKVRKLILESASPGLRTEAERHERRIQDKKLSEKIQHEGIKNFIDYWENIPLFHSQKSLPEKIRTRIRSQRLANSIDGLANSLNGMGTGVQPSWWDELAHLEMPVLLITGNLDQKFCRIAEEMSKILPNVKWKTAEDAGHAIHVEKPELFGTIVSGFLSQTGENNTNGSKD
ncbi:2-succinyl-6-hydroxy-2,4-cyclohexadiene-1-carboxylate synthase [Cytobacillus oceanisediminis]|uniref:Putative 2-succinyl-6-hydroxy-2,4-cyclohexadiene-1-carboxylate synthase n=1 Tax=Cytobacillus oceanisediminis TaxID=665099 RepID=A0ABX3CUH0_9BACI|nr:2-succinyl-6-hydroxy-2,4-cyclohexadiene-1-carboxylate synthase [Cytobacillus oceanisediminis]OHX49127.1 2-succinyl-6-hydroxy-2,4-cyclohexadiene-1-carboxylate synthase [Cytobacillus oceanisediminis]